MNRRTKAYLATSFIWTTMLIFALAYVFATVGCSPIGQTYTSVQGPKGDTGSPVAVVAAPATYLECPTGGTDLLIGSVPLTICNGATGATGATIVGPVGPAGQDGTDSTPIIVVPLCPGTSNYGVFVEVALNIGGKLFGIYSQNGGFLTYLAPGNYTSNAIGSACNLTINSDGTVSH